MPDTIFAEPKHADATATVQDWVDRFSATLAAGDAAGASHLFATTCFWRDLIAFTWNIKTIEGREAIAEMLETTLPFVKPSNCRVDGAVEEVDGVVSAWLLFETALARCKGYVRLRDGRAWTLLTVMAELKGHEEARGPKRKMGAEHGVHTGRRSWLEQREADAAELGISRQPFCLVIGGGQGGLGLGARLKQLGVPTLIIDQHARPGDAWRHRYRSLCLHDPVWYDHMPYLPFPENWPVFASKDKVGDWLEMYAKVMELDLWNSTRCLRASFDDNAKEWTVDVERNGEKFTLRPKQLVLATGMSGLPSPVRFKGMDRFQGQQHHSSKHPGGEAFNGKKCVVIGSNNSAHDICADLWEQGADVTMVQRSSTHISRSETLMDVVVGGLYSEQALATGITTEKADLTFASIPYRVLPDIHKGLYEEIQRRDADFYERLRGAGFMLDFGDDGSGLFLKYLRRGSGYYIDVGASELIANGSIKLRSGVDVEEIREHSVVLNDGTELSAHLIVYATGYGSMNGWVAKLISQEVADKVGKCWGLGSATTKDPGPWEGEQRNMWKPTQQEALWFHGGNLHQSRHYSQFLALQLKARQAGLPTPVYGLQEVHHKG